MLKKSITYEDYNGVERKEDFYFNLSNADILEMEMGTSGGLTGLINRVVETQDAPTMIKIFKDLILRAYGQKSLDGRRFIKSKELSEEFSQTEAYSILFMELASNADAAAAFVNGIVPADAAAELAKQNNNVSVTPAITTITNE